MLPIYLDHAASTRPDDEVIALMGEVMRTAWSNPHAAHPAGAVARGVIAEARTRLLHALGDRGTPPLGDIVWTSGCTESDALAVLGGARLRAGALVLSAIEHSAVTVPAMDLEQQGRQVVRVAPNADGVLDPDQVAAAAGAAAAAMVAIVMVQNEVGTVQPISAIAAAVRARLPGCHLHVDAAQAFGKVPLDVATLGADSIALAAHKLAGPKGIGALWLRTGATLAPLWGGGGQQGGLRGGTQDAPSAAGFGLAAEKAMRELAVTRTHWLELAARVTSRLAARGVEFRQLVPDQRRAPHILALAFEGVPADALRTILASRGVYAATGSACSSREQKPSAVLVALGLPPSIGICRLSFGRDTTLAEVETAAGIVADCVATIRTPSRT